jgi:HK97 family phage prohead protease
MLAQVVRFAAALTRSEIDGNTLFGHAAVFEQPTFVSGYHEVISRSAFDKVLANEHTDVRALINHDPNQILGRQSANTLRLNTDDDGLTFEVDLPDTSYGRDLRESMQRGDIDGASFMFYAGETSQDKHEGKYMLRHDSVSRLVDVSVVTFPAYQGAGASLRSVQRQNLRSQLIKARAAILFGVKK